MIGFRRAPQPYADGLEHTRDLLRDMRDAALDAIDHEPQPVQDARVAVPIVMLDLMILNLDGAKSYRDTLRVRVRRMLLVSMTLAGLGFVCGLVSLFLTTARVWLR